MARQRVNPPSRGAKVQKPTEDDFSAAAVQHWVLMETIQHPATILPAAGAVVSAAWNGAFGVTPGGLAITMGLVFVSGASWIYNFFIRGESLAEARVQSLLEASVVGEERDLEELIENCKQVKFAEGAKEAEEILTAYRRLCGFLDQQVSAEGNISAERLRSLARDTFREAVTLIQQALVMWEALTTVDVGLLKKELAKWEAALAQDKHRDPARRSTQEQQIESHKKRLASFEGRKRDLVAVLAQLNDLEGALERAYLESINVVDQNSTSLLQMRSAATQLERAVDAARRVEDKLKDSGSKDDGADDVYLAASKRIEP